MPTKTKSTTKKSTAKQRPSSLHAPPSTLHSSRSTLHAPLSRGGDPSLVAKPVSDSRIRLSLPMNPDMANALGDVHGGMIMKLVDEAGGFAAMKHARNVTVTVAMDSMTFLSPVHVGDLLTLNASVNWVGRSSIEVGVRVEAENVLTGHITHTNSAYLVYVALDQYGHPTAAPPLLLESPEEQRRWEQGEARQAHRLKHATPKPHHT